MNLRVSKQYLKFIFVLIVTFIIFAVNHLVFINKTTSKLELLEIKVNKIANAIQGETFLSYNDENHVENNKNIESHINLYDMNQLNENKFECVKTKKIIIQTTICLHQKGRDVHVGQAIRINGSWEEPLLTLFMHLLNSMPDLNAFDIGANLGQYTLFAAKLGRKCVAVEPFHENYIRLHKSALIENTQTNIILVNNGITEQSGVIKRLSYKISNIGAQSLLFNNDDRIDKKQAEFMIKTILLDDLVEVLPSDFKKAIMKIDIEGYELKAFTKASKLFDRVDIYAVLIEWSGKSNKAIFNNTQEFENYFEFMINRNYRVYNSFTLKELEIKDYLRWPSDVVWIRNDFEFNRENYGISKV